ncbi:IgA-binding beta antigen [Streptococcus pneumoniae]|uniref:RICH domain-containing protein n=2 Tax=Streptococcus pneumoniae TaxID=1313 RepID=UPI0005E42C25|nr:RICH domain-containing protein [Streptococcus pneumoniae]CJW20246.1 IgA-binding beta antigen [Streptococcus pneumoniae]CJZ86310.1 IgA-binding beta antigen [Streptococcus pneumoniae]
MFASKSERKVRYSIRKFSIGVASVVVASLFLGGVVHAEGVGGTSQGIPLKATDKDELYEKAVKEVNIEISKHMSNRLDQLDRQSSGFTEILKKIQGVVESYRQKIDSVSTKSMVEELGRQAKKEIDEEIKLFQNHSDGKSTPKDTSRNDGVQGDDSSVGQGEQPGASNPGDSKPVPPETSGETKPKDSNDSTTTLEKELKEAKETAKTTLDNYMLTRLKRENGGAFWFGELLKESKESVEKYKKMFDEASSKERVETLVKEAEQEIEALVVKHKGREIGLERDKAKEEVTKHLTGLLDDIKKNLEKEQHINTVELIKKLKDIEKTYLHKLDESTQKAQLKKLVAESRSKLDEALSNFKKSLSSSSNSGSSTKPETPEKPEKPTPSKPAEKEQNPSGSTAGSHSGSTSSSGSSSASTKPKSPEKPERPAPSKPAEKEQNPSGSTAGSHSGSTSSSGSSSASTKPKSPEKPEEPAPSKPAEKEQNPSGTTAGSHSGSTSSSGSSSASTKPESPEKEQEVEPSTPSKPSGNETNSSSPTRSNSLSPTLSSQPTSTVQKVFTTQNGNTKITVMFETATEADSVNLKEVTTKEMIDNVTRQTGQGTVRIFDISLSKDGKETHVKGERVVRLAIGNIDSEIQVYHVKENGELELLPSTVENGQVVFKTSHFSLFAIKMLPKKQMVAEPEANREGKTQSDDKEMVLLADKANQMSENRSNSDKKDKQALPSTGTMSTLLMEFLGLISLVGVYLLKGKKTEND